MRAWTWLALAASAGAVAGAALAWEIGHVRPTWLDPDRGNRAVQVDLYYPSPSAGENATPATAPADGFPTLVFGHGFLMSADRYGWLRDALIPAGRWLALPRTETGFSPSHLALAQDLAFIARRLRQEGASPASPWHGRIGTLAAGGHSMGGGAAVLAASFEPALAGLASLAPAETSPSAVGAAPLVTVPALLLAGDDDCVTPTAQHAGPIHAALGSGCRDLVELNGAGHCQFADFDTACNLGELFCPAPDLSRAQQQAAAAALLAPWLDALGGDAAAWNGYLEVRDGLAGSVASVCPAPPALEMGLVAMFADAGTPRVCWPPSAGATGYFVEGATPVAWPVFDSLAVTADTTWSVDPAAPQRFFRVRARRP